MDDDSTARDLSWRVRLVVLGILLAVLVIFIVANSATVAEIRTRLVWALLLSALLGFLLGALVMRLRR
jgi:flagellar biosynthesis protein FliR